MEAITLYYHIFPCVAAGISLLLPQSGKERNKTDTNDTTRNNAKTQYTTHALLNDEQDVCEDAIENYLRCQAVILEKIFLSISPTHGTFLYGRCVCLLFLNKTIVQLHVYSF